MFMESSSWALLSLELFSTLHPPQKRYQRKSGSPGNLGIAVIPRNFSVDELKEKTGVCLREEDRTVGDADTVKM